MTFFVVLLVLAATVALATRNGHRERWSRRYYSAWDPDALWTRRP